MKAFRLTIAVFSAIILLTLFSCGDSSVETEDLNDSERESVEATTNFVGDTDADSKADDTCVACEHVNVQEVEIQATTCSNPGFYDVVCIDCGEKIDFIQSETLSHTEGEWKTEIEPTNTTKGLEYTFCTVCGERLTRAIETVKYSEGLEFRSNGDGTCSLASRGSCTDREIWVSPTSPSGDIVTFVGTNAFEDDERLVAIHLPDTVAAIGDNAFWGCESLESIKMPKALLTIGSNAFNSCRALTGIILPEGLVSIDGGAFSSCNKVAELHIPASVSYIGENILSPKSTQSITVDEKNVNYKVISNCLISTDGILIVGYGECEIPQGVSKICSYAFIGNKEMKTATIPSSVKEIGSFAFCMTGIENAVIPYGVRAIGNGAFDSCEMLSSIVIPITVEKIGYWAFDGCIRLASLKYYGSEEDWNKIDIHSDNEGLDYLDVIFIDEVSPDSVYGYGRRTVSGRAALLYDAIERAVCASVPQEKIELDLADEITIDDFYVARAIFLSDHPECFWWSGNAIYYYNSSGFLKLIELEYIYSGDELEGMKAELEAEIAKILAELPDGSVLDKALYLHDAVAWRVSYELTDNDQNPYGALVEGRAVCNGYATAYQMLLQRAGIRAWTVNGVAGGESHAWNVVWLSESVCVYTDVTWDDQKSVMHYYFNMSLDEIDDDHKANTLFDLPECGHTEYSYNDVKPDCNYITDSDRAEALVSIFGELKDGERVARFYYNGNDFSAWLSKNSRRIYASLGCDALSYYNLGNEYVLVAGGFDS